MQVEIKIDSSCIDPKVIILTASMTEDVSNIVKKLSENSSQIISGYKDEKIDRLLSVLHWSRYASDVDYSKRFYRFSGYMQLYGTWILSVLLRVLVLHAANNVGKVPSARGQGMRRSLCDRMKRL